MNQIKTRVLRACAAAAALVAATPTVALAEEENTGLRLLLPNMAEFVPACLAFIIIFLIMSKFAWPMILDMMQQREDKIEGDLKAAADAKEKAEEDARAYEQRIHDAEREAADIISAAKREAEEERAEILAKAQKEAAATIAKSRDAVEAERKKAMIELSSSVVDLSVEIASKIIGNDLDASQHRALAEKYLAEVGSSDANQS